MKTLNEFSPLTPAVFYILFSLALCDKHGYEIMKQVRSDSEGKVKMGNGTLYGSIKRMLEGKLLEESGEKQDSHNERRKYYRLTDLGRKTLDSEMQRYIETTSLIRKRNLLSALSVKINI